MLCEETCDRPKSAGDIPIVLPPKCFIDGRQFRTCRIFRNSYLNLKGYHMRFTLQTESTARLHAKCKLYSGNNKITICKNREPHLGEAGDYTILFNKERDHFCLRKSSQYGKDLMSISIKTSKKYPREICISVDQSYCENALPRELKTAKPVLLYGLKWCVDLHANSVVQSNKNCCIEDDKHVQYMFIRKLSTNVLELEAMTAISDSMMFALGIISFVCK